MVRCMMNGVIYYPGADDVLEAEAAHELQAALRDCKVIESHHDHLGRPRLKIVYVDAGDYFSGNPLKEAYQHIVTISKAEKDKEKRDGIRRPRLIFVKQDRDYWPDSEKDPDVMARRAVKESMAEPFFGPDHTEITVPPLPEEEELELPPDYADSAIQEAYELQMDKLSFMRYFDPAMPGTKFILDHMPTHRDYVLNKYMEDPELWKEWMRVSQMDTAHAVNK